MSKSRFAFTVLAFGYAFLYLPIALVMVYSFNESRLVTVWAGFSTKWWEALMHNEAMLDAAWLSLRIALASATLATLLGLAAGYALDRVPRFAGRTLFASLVIAPMVMPGFSDSNPFRTAFPDAVVYGFCPYREVDLLHAAPLIHGADERIPVSDVEFSARFFYELPQRILA